MEQTLSTSTILSQRLDTSLLQFLDMITMPSQELNERIKAEAEKNPVLEIKDSTSSFEAISSRGGERRTSSDEANSSDYSEDDPSDWFEKTVSEKEDLREHLINELGCLDIDPPVRETAETIISALDMYGFTGPNPELLVPEREKPYVKDAVKVIQTLEPTGVGAKDWREALMLQIREIESNREEVSRYRDIIYHGLDYIKDGEEDRLAKALRIGREDLGEMIKVIKSLTPYPGLKYTSDYTPYVIPEIQITVKDGIVVLKMLSSGLLDAGIDNTYLELKDELKSKDDRKDKEANKFLRENISSAEHLIKIIRLRKETMKKIGMMLVEKQHDFFLYGPMFLKALTMTQAAEILGVNVSTVSKLAQDKYVLTDWGTYPLRFFFSTEVKTSNSEDEGELSKTAVIYKIREILENDTSGKKLSDQKIADLLEEEGIHVARRTVNKYRREIESSPN